MKKITFLLMFIGSFYSMSKAQMINTFPHTENFEGFAQCGGSCTSSCGLQSGWTNQGTRHFSSDVNGTSSSNTGPTANGGADHNPGIAGGRYLYAETSSGCTPSNQWELVSPQIDLVATNAVQFEFWYHMYGATMGTAHVDITDDGGTTWNLDVIPAWTDNRDIWQMKSINLASYIGDTVNIRIRYISGTSYTGDFAVDDVKIYDLLQLDAGISAIDTPSTPACNLSNNVWATIKNYGTDTITSATVEWEVNGTAQTPYSFSGTLSSLKDTTVMIGTSAATVTHGSAIKVWTKLPNGAAESALSGAANDTARSKVVEGLNGLYTIGGISPDFSTIDSARMALEARGVCGPTTFDIRSGVYTEQVTFTPITGASSTNTITFKSEANHKDSVLWSFGTAASMSNWTVNLDGADYFHFELMTISNTTANYGRVVLVQNGATWNKFSYNCLVNDTTPTTTSSVMAVIYSAPGSLDHNNTFDNNIIWGGSNGARWFGASSSSLEDGTKFTNNLFKNQYYTAAYIRYQNNLSFNNNKITTNSTRTGSKYLLEMHECNNSSSVTGNEIHGPSTGSGIIHGIYMQGCLGSNANKGVIANNMIHVGAQAYTGSAYGIIVSYSSYQHVLNNNILIENANNFSTAFYGNDGGGNVLMNNNLVNLGAGGALYLGDNLAFPNSDYNNIYSPVGDYAYYNNGSRANLAALQAQGIDTNSISVDPLYYSSTDLHTCAAGIDGKGSVNALVSQDFDGQPRHSSTPDIGADEFVNVNNYSIGNDVVLCSGDSVQLFAGGSANDTILWSTGDTTSTIWVSTPGTYWANLNSVCGSASDTIVVSAGTLTAGFTHVKSFLTSVFTNTTTGNPTGFTYLWNFGDGNTSTAINPTHIYASSGSYNVTLHVTGPCGTDSISDTVTVNVVGMDEIVVGGKFTLYPNPATNNLTVGVELIENGDATVHITDLTGRVVYNKDLGNLSTGKTSIPVNISTLNTGAYFVVLKINDLVFTQKLSVFK